MNDADASPASLRVVFDCGVVLQAALRRSSPAGACLDLVDEGRVELVISEAVFAEIREVLERPELKPRRKGRLTDQIVADILTWLREHATLVEDAPPRFR